MTDQKFLQEAEHLIDSILTSMETEQQAIMKSDPDAIDSAMTGKAELLNQMAKLEPRLTDLLKSSDVAGNVESIKTKLRECQSKNRENRLLTIQGLNVVDKSISFFESLMQIGSAKVYDADGNTNGRSMKRNIGTA